MNRRPAPRLLCLLVAAALAAPVLAAEGDIDATFGAGGFRAIPFDYAGDKADTPEDLLELADGSVVAVGRARKNASATAAVSTKLTSNGALVSGWGVSGKSQLALGPGTEAGDQAYLGATQLPDGRVILVGFTDTIEASAKHTGLLAMVGAATGGVQDVTHSAQNPVTTEYTAVAVDPQGRAVPTGVWQGPSDDAEFHARRYLPNLQSFDGNFALSSDSIIPIDLAIQGIDASTGIVHLPDGTFLQGGFTQITGTDFDFALVRSLPNGDLDDQGFGIATFAFDVAGSNKNDRMRALAIDPQGRVLMAGEVARGASGFDTDIGIVRLKSNLTPDGDFGTNGRLVISFDIFDQTARDELGGIAFAPDGKILVVGTHFTGDAANVSDVALVRLEDDGDADFTFGTFGREFYDFGSGATQKDVGVDVIAQDGRAVVLSQREFNGADTDFVVFGVVSTSPPKPDGVFATSFE